MNFIIPPFLMEWEHRNCPNYIEPHPLYKTHILQSLNRDYEKHIAQIWFRWGKAFSSYPIVWDDHDKNLN